MDLKSKFQPEPTPSELVFKKYEYRSARLTAAFKKIGGDIRSKPYAKIKLRYMCAMDQYARNAIVTIINSGGDDHIVNKLSDRIRQTDLQNTVDLKEMLTVWGWFTISEFGKKADRHTWLLVQHADADPDFQKHILGTLEKLYPHGETDRINYAYLYDRVAVQVGNPEKRQLQRYGTQGYNDAVDGYWKLHPVEDAKNLDKRRQEMGLEPVAQYIAHFPRLPKKPSL